MELRSGRRLRSSSEQLGVGEDRISALPEELILLVLARLRCFRAAVRTGALARRWRGLWAGLRKVFFSDVPFRSLEGALQRVPGPPPAVSLLDIRVPERRTRKRATMQRRRAHSARLRSVLRAAARLEPEELVFELPSVFTDNNSPTSFVHLPAGVEFPALETLSLSGCHVCFDSLLPSCPRLRVLRIRFNEHGFHEHLVKNFMSVHSASLQELFVEAENLGIDTVDLVAPQLKQLTVSLKAHRAVNISILAPMVEKFSWQWSYPFNTIKFGLWQLVKFRLQTAGTQGQLPSLHIHARITSSIVHGEAENSTQEIDKHMIAKPSVLELHLKTKGHVFGAFVFHLLGMNRFFGSTRRLKVVLLRSAFTQECPPDCACDHPDWRSQTSSLTALEELEINGFEGYDHETDFLKLIFKCAPMLKRMRVCLSHDASSRDDGCTQIHNIFREYSSVECYLYLSSGLMHGSDDCPST